MRRNCARALKPNVGLDFFLPAAEDDFRTGFVRIPDVCIYSYIQRGGKPKVSESNCEQGCRDGARG